MNVFILQYCHRQDKLQIWIQRFVLESVILSCHPNQWSHPLLGTPARPIKEMASGNGIAGSLLHSCSPPPDQAPRLPQCLAPCNSPISRISPPFQHVFSLQDVHLLSTPQAPAFPCDNLHAKAQRMISLLTNSCLFVSGRILLSSGVTSSHTASSRLVLRSSKVQFQTLHMQYNYLWQLLDSIHNLSFFLPSTATQCNVSLLIPVCKWADWLRAKSPRHNTHVSVHAVGGLMPISLTHSHYPDLSSSWFSHLFASQQALEHISSAPTPASRAPVN